MNCKFYFGSLRYNNYIKYSPPRTFFIGTFFTNALFKNIGPETYTSYYNNERL